MIIKVKHPLLGLALLACVFSSTASKAADKPVELDCSVNQSMFDHWFEEGKVTQDGVVKNADSLNFPLVNNNCDFYQWAAQMFLWITSPTPDASRTFESTTFFDVSLEKGGVRTLISHDPSTLKKVSPLVRLKGPQRLPVIKHPETGELLEIDNIPILDGNKQQLVEDIKGAITGAERFVTNGKSITFYDKSGNKIKSAKPVFSKGLNTEKLVRAFSIGEKTVYVDAKGALVDEFSVGQAGGADVLMSQKGGLVYYTIMVNDVFAVFRTLYPEATKFPDTQDQLDELSAVSRIIGLLPKPMRNKDALAIEMKMSWVEARYVNNPEQYIQIEAEIPDYPEYDENKPTTLWTSTTTKKTTLALTGIHVVGNVAGHPEMLWASFEHINNTPMGSYDYIDREGNKKSVPTSTEGNWLFAKNPPKAPFNEPHMSASGNTIQAKPGFKISPSETLRDNPWGAVKGTPPNPEVDAAGSNSQIISLNESVAGRLADGDVRKNYKLIGNTWTRELNKNGDKVGHLPKGEYSDGGNEVGTSRLANATMETYHQDFNCFVCHSSGKKDGEDNFTGLSHIFNEIVPLHPNKLFKSVEK